MSSGSFFTVMRTSSSLCTLTPSFEKIDIVSSSANCPTLINESGKSFNVSALTAFADNFLNGSAVTWTPLLVPPLATPTRLFDFFNIGNPNSFLSSSLTTNCRSFATSASFRKDAEVFFSRKI